MNLSGKIKRNRIYPVIIIVVFILVFVKTYSQKK